MMATVRVTVARSGVWFGESGSSRGWPTVITPANCAELVANFDRRPHDLRPLLKHGHPSDGHEGRPAGYIARLKLLGDADDCRVSAVIVGVDDDLAASMARGEQALSPEIYADYAKVNRLRCAEGKGSSDVLGMVLRGVAVIGGEAPAIRGLGSDAEILMTSAPETTSTPEVAR
jgi:hypothetical protein